jgi:uncharacterized protein DUF3224
MQMFRALLLLPIALVLIIPVHAAAPSHLTGSLIVTSLNPVSTRTFGNNTVLVANGTFSLTGGIQGQSVYFVTFVFHNSTGILDFKGHATFTGTVAGSQSGSMDIAITGNATFVGSSLTSIFEHLVLRHGTGGLAGIHGQGTDVGTGPNTLAYSITVRLGRS